MTPTLLWSFSSVYQRLVLRGQQALEFAQARFDFTRLTTVAHHRIQRLQSVAGDAQDGGIFGGNPAEDSAVLCVTGNGLKTLDAVMGHCGQPREIKPSLREFESLLAAENQSLVNA